MARPGKSTGSRQPTKEFSYVRYIPCQVEPGMFRDEWLVSLDVYLPSDPENSLRVQSLVDAREVKFPRDVTSEPKQNQPVRGWLRVALARKEKGFLRVVLPQPASPGGQDVWVRPEQVRKEV